MHSDFWWLPDCTDGWTVGVAHQEALADTDDPASAEWSYLGNQGGLLRPSPPEASVSLLPDWRVRWQNTNVYRTLAVSTPDGGQVIGPFVVDIDSDYGQDLDDALAVTRRVMDWLLGDRQVTAPDIRVFFSGRKGFNIEVRPVALGVPLDIRSALDPCHSTLWQVIRSLRAEGLTGNYITSKGTVIDSIYGSRLATPGLKHPYLRLHDSINCWLGSDGTRRLRMKIEITRDELDGPLAPIVEKSESHCSDRTDSRDAR